MFTVGERKSQIGVRLFGVHYSSANCRAGERPAAECCERSEQCIEAPAGRSLRYNFCYAKITQRPPKQVPECCAEGAVYRRHRHLFRSLRYNFCCAKITQRPTLRQGWKRLCVGGAPQACRGGGATGGSHVRHVCRARAGRLRILADSPTAAREETGFREGAPPSRSGTRGPAAARGSAPGGWPDINL